MSGSEQAQSGLMVYPRSGWRKWFFKFPLWLWRLGLGPFMPGFLLLTTQGRKSREPRHTMLEFTKLHDRYYLLSGWGLRSDWVKNLQAHPEVTISTLQDGVRYGTARRVADSDEIRALFEAMKASPTVAPYLKSLGIQPNIEDILAKQDRIVAFAIDPVQVAINPLPSMRPDLAWVWPAGAFALSVLRAVTRRRRR